MNDTTEGSTVSRVVCPAVLDLAIRPLVGLPEDQFAFALVPVGIPAEEKPPRTQYEESRVHWERYSA